MKPLVTVLIDTYNYGHFLEQAIDSVLAQDYPSDQFEILVVDDGSTDDTANRVKKYGARITYLPKPNGGQASAFNYGFARAQGEYIALLDADDWWEPGKLSHVIRTFEQHPEAAAVSHAYLQAHEHTEQSHVCGPPTMIFLSLRTREDARIARSNWPFLQTSALTVRRKIFEAISTIPEELVFNADAPLATASMAMGALVLPERLSSYRFHAANLYIVAAGDTARLRRRAEMNDLMFGLLQPMLLRLGVAPDCVSALIDESWIDGNRAALGSIGGSRFSTFRTEMHSFRSECKNPSWAYVLFKYIAVGAATLLLPPQYFYKARNWYAQNGLARVRGWFVKTSHTNPQPGLSTPKTDSKQ